MSNIPGPLERLMDEYNEERGIATGGTPRTYRDNTAPSDPELGDFWYDTSTSVLRVYAETSAGPSWTTADPVRVTEEAQTFAESDVTLTTSGTGVSSNQVEIQGTETTVAGPSLGSTTSDVDSRGLKVNPNTELDRIQVDLNSNITGAPQDVFVANADTNTIVAENTSGHSSGDTVSVTGTFSSGQDYWVGIYDDGGSMDHAFNSSPGTFPFTSGNIDVVGAGFNISPDDGDSPSDSTTWYNFDNVRGRTAGTSGTAQVTFDSGTPADSTGWDLATVTKNADGESATVDIEDSNGNVLVSDVSGKVDLHEYGTSTDIQFAISLSRSNTNNNPRVEYVSRRYVR